MIQIYKPSNTDYSKNGDQTLFPVSASVHAILNGAWEAEITHTIDAEGRWKYITEEAVIKMPSFNGDQLFRVKTAQKQDSGVTATLEPIFYDSMGDCWLSDVRPTGKNGQDALDIMLAPNSKYSGQSDITRASTAYYQYVNFMEALNGDIDQSFINRWGGEILFDNFTVIVNEQVGSDNGVELRYGKNIPQDGMSYEVDIRDVVTRIYPKAYNGRTMTGNGHVDSPLIENYPTVKTVTMTFENVKLAEDLQGDPEDTDIVCDTQEELDAALTAQCNAQYEAGIDKPVVTINADMVLLQNTEQYKDVEMLESVSLGDTIHCINTHLDITTDARVIELEYDSIRKKVTAVTIGEFGYQYFDGITSSSQKIDSVIAPNGSLMAEKVQGILNGIYTQLRLQSTAAQKVEGSAFLIEDTDEESALYGAMVWGTQGLQLATSRTADGKNWDWTTAVTAKGIVASVIVSGILTDKEGKNYWNLDTGEFRLSAEAFKVDDQTVQDYVDGQIDEKIAQIRTLTMQLSNEFTGVATDSNGSGGDYSDCYTDALLYIGSTDITESDAVQWTVNPSAGVTGNWNEAQHRYSITYLSGDNGTVSVSATYSGLVITKTFAIAKVKQGVQGNTGIQGPPGEDGKSLYTWIKYADSPTSGMSDNPSGKDYIGIAYNKTTPRESENYSDYAWSLYKGDQGIQGVPGKNGETYYTWIKYATSATGANMSDDPTGKTYLGIAYNKTTPTESTDPSDYTWSLFQGPQGEKGEQGIPGTNGTDGRTSYFHIKYSANASGNPMSETPNTYIGTYVDFTQADSTDPSDYTWSRFEGAQGPQGTQGIPGTNGTNGKTSYLHIKYSNDGGASFTPNSGETPGKYIGQYVDFTQADSTNVNSYTWSLTQGDDGRVYMIQASAQVMSQGADDAFTPPTITFSAYYRDGQSAARTPYAGRFIIQDTINGTDYITRWTSAVDQTSVTYTPSSADVKNVRCTLYAAGGTTNALDMQGVAIVRDIDNLTQEEVFNILTNNGAAQGIYMQDGNLYINGTYIRGGTIQGQIFRGGSIYITYQNEDGQTVEIFSANENGVGIGPGGGIITYYSGDTFVSINGELRLTSGKMTGYMNGQKALEIDRNIIRFYSWNDSGNYVGSMASVKRSSDGRVGLGIYCDHGDIFQLGYQDGDQTGISYPVIAIDANDGQTPPWIAGGATGTIFGQNGKGITFKNGILTEWGLNLYTGNVAVGGTTLHFSAGLLTGVN